MFFLGGTAICNSSYSLRLLPTWRLACFLHQVLCAARFAAATIWHRRGKNEQSCNIPPGHPHFWAARFGGGVIVYACVCRRTRTHQSIQGTRTDRTQWQDDTCASRGGCRGRGYGENGRGWLGWHNFP